MKYLALLLLLSGCATAPKGPYMYDCQLLPYAMTLKVERYDMGAAVDDAKTVAKRLDLKNTDIVCRQEP